MVLRETYNFKDRVMQTNHRKVCLEIMEKAKDMKPRFGKIRSTPCVMWISIHLVDQRMDLKDPIIVVLELPEFMVEILKLPTSGRIIWVE